MIQDFPEGHIFQQSPTCRKVIYKNWHRLRERYLILGSYLEKRQWSWKIDFWYAKVRRKIILLRKLCNEFEQQQDCHCKFCADKQPIAERVLFIRQRIDAIEETLKPYAELFTQVPMDYGYACESPFAAEKKLKIEKRKALHDALLIKRFKENVFQTVESAHQNNL
jgi:hypothetical protein